MLTEYKMNLEKSLEVYNECDFIKMKHCYNNVFNMIFPYHEQFKSGEWRIAYGYYTAIEGLMARHCFILTSEDEVIDPTILATDTFDPEKEKVYVAFKVFGSIKEYLDVLADNDREPALFNVYYDLEMKANEWAKQKQVFLMG